MTVGKNSWSILKWLHISLQFSDGPKQKEHDVIEMFELGADIITGTEAGEDVLWNLIVKYAEEFGYRVKRYRSNFICIKKEIIKRGSWTSGGVTVEDKEKVFGPGHDSAFPWVGFTHRTPGIGEIFIAAGHYPTKGRRPGDPNYLVNKKYAGKVSDWAVEKGKGTALAFYAGDQNMPDDRSDTFFGGPLTSIWDELGKHQNTGHGNIDIVASYNHDGRVTALSVRACNDREWFMHSDHFPVIARYRIKHLEDKPTI